MPAYLPPAEFSVGLRGYDRQQVRSLTERLRTGTVAGPQARTELGELDTVWRGYDQQQVRFAVRYLITALERGRPPDIPMFDLVIRGYDPDHVDALLRRIHSGSMTPTQVLAELDNVDDYVQGYEKMEVRFVLNHLKDPAG